MNYKKIAITAAAGALMLGAAMPALADDGGFLLVKIKNWAKVKNVVVTTANTGGNDIHGKIVVGGDIDTGNADAGALVTNTVNSNLVDLCDCLDGDGAAIVKIKNGAKVKNVVITTANTGDNSIHGKVVVGGDIDTGEAGAGALVTNVVNTNVVGDATP